MVIIIENTIKAAKMAAIEDGRNFKELLEGWLAAGKPRK